MSEIKKILRECERKELRDDFLAIFVGFPVIGFLFAVALCGAYLLMS